ncbi:glutathione S-transferase Mu 1 isoform X2 [Piliocolobus tephrosceles]|uniref:Glutathione S-transferase n=1 Tax=Piliocolobus tephrosceles TaxID=591936 RepID=A0A8C9HV85_9PRIM|nr:glutathione S-transferase Mu 1 isoform X2 [Piliocolobus tephrosceles]
MSMTLGYWDIRGLPYLIDGTHKITQSNAILRYIARKHNLCGETEEEKIRVDILENQAMDVSNQLARVCYSPDFEKLKPEYLEGLPTMMQHFSQFLGKRPWFVGDKITFVDFLAYDVLDLHRIFEPKCLDAFPNLKDFISRFEVMPPSSFLFDAPCSVTSFEMLSQSWSYTKNNLHLLSAGFVPGTVPSTLYLLCGL